MTKAFYSPNGMNVNLYLPQGVTNVVKSRESSSSRI